MACRLRISSLSSPRAQVLIVDLQVHGATGLSRRESRAAPEMPPAAPQPSEHPAPKTGPHQPPADPCIEVDPVDPATDEEGSGAEGRAGAKAPEQAQEAGGNNRL